MSRLPRWLRWRSREELEEEIQAHIDLETQSAIERGLTPEEARYAASRAIGNATRVKERAREADPLAWMESIAKDLRYALRSLARSPSFTVAAVLSLALGSGVNSAIFSFVDGLILRPIQVPRASELVRIHATSPEYRFAHFSYREYAALRDQNRTLAGLAAEKDAFLAIQTQADDLPRFAYGDFVSGNYFSMLRIPAALGRTFGPEEDSPALERIPVVVSQQAWESKFHHDPNIIGSEVRINAQLATIVGVLPEKFSGTLSLAPEIYLPLNASLRIYPSGITLTSRTDRSLGLLGRSRPGIGISTVQADFATLSNALESAYPVID